MFILFSVFQTILKLFEERVVTLRKIYERIKWCDVKLNLFRSLKSFSTNSYLFLILGKVSYFKFREHSQIILEPNTILLATNLKILFAWLVCADYFGAANLCCKSFLHDFSCFFNNLSWYLPIKGKSRLLICVKITDFQKVESSFLVLDEIANESV